MNREEQHKEAIDTINDLITTVHHNACTATIEACAKQWGLYNENGEWKKEFEHLLHPAHPPINTIKKL